MALRSIIGYGFIAIKLQGHIPLLESGVPNIGSVTQAVLDNMSATVSLKVGIECGDTWVRIKAARMRDGEQEFDDALAKVITALEAMTGKIEHWSLEFRMAEYDEPCPHHGPDTGETTPCCRHGRKR